MLRLMIVKNVFNNNKFHFIIYVYRMFWLKRSKHKAKKAMWDEEMCVREREREGAHALRDLKNRENEVDAPNTQFNGVRHTGVCLRLVANYSSGESSCCCFSRFLAHSSCVIFNFPRKRKKMLTKQTNTQFHQCYQVLTFSIQRLFIFWCAYRNF